MGASLRTILLASASAGGLLIHVSAAQAWQPRDNSAAPTGLDEIIVTAQKRQENLQDTPISITVMSGDDLQTRGITTINDFASGAVPALRMAPSYGRSSTMMIGMRGVVPSDPGQISRDPVVGVYVDGVYLGRAQGLGAELFDIERIEVLRGPQGTLFGRNAVGGALSIVTRKPSGEWGADITAGVRNFDGYNVKAHVDLPEVAGIRVKIDGLISKRDSWIENPLKGQADWYDIDRKGLRISALWQPTDTIEIQYSFDISRDGQGNGYQHVRELLDGAPPLAPIFSLEPDPVSVSRAGVPLQLNMGKSHGHHIHASWEMSDALTLRSITAFRSLHQTTNENAGGSFMAYRPNGTFGRYSQSWVDQDQFSQEVQLIGSLPNLDFVLGGFYYEEDGADSSYASQTAMFNSTGTGYIILPEPVGGPAPDRASEAHAKSTAVFGHATWTPPVLDERLHLTAGLRWTRDRKQGELTALRGESTPFAFRFRSSRVDPAFAIGYDLSDGVNTYLRWGRAYRAGGANSRSATYRAFDPEQLTSWEAGLKMDFLDRRARLNIAAYTSRFTNRQVDFSNPVNPSNLETVNLDVPMKMKGIELDLTVRPTQPLTLGLNYVYTHTTKPHETDPFTGNSVTTVPAYTPSHAATGSLDYEFEPFSFGTLRVHADAVYSGSFHSLATAPKTASHVLLNGRITLGEIRLGNDETELSLSLWGKNLTNKRWVQFQYYLQGRGLNNVLLTNFAEPRTYGLEARLKF